MTSSRIEPLRIYVLWHANCLLGKGFAKDIYTWFRGNPGDIYQCGYGIPVEYRSYPAGVEPKKRKPVELDQADINILVPLVDEHMVVDVHWRKDLEDLADAGSQVRSLICPVALHPTAYQLPEKITRLNFLRVDRVNDPQDWSEAERLQVRRQRLLSLLTQACCRLMWQQDETGAIDLDAPSAPIKVFISHAKVDGTDIAEAIRDQIYQHGQLQAFFDESDLAIGHTWDAGLRNNAQLGTTAMISVLTDAYASRPWCRREIRLARKARPILSQQPGAKDGTNGEEDPYCWIVKPIIVVDALVNGSTSFLPEFGPAPFVRWNRERASLIIDQLLREILLYGYNERRVRNFLQNNPKKQGQHYLNCIPDFQTILELWQTTQKCIQGQESSTLTRLVIPPPGIPLSEEQMLREFLPSMTELQIVTFDDVMEVDDQTLLLTGTQPPLENKLIAVSISDSANLIQFGFSIEHLHELTINVARLVLRLGGNLAYGGDLRPSGFTETLFLLARGEHMNTKGWEQRLYSFLAWPYYQSLTIADEAKLINTCCFVRIRPEVSKDLKQPGNDREAIDPNTPEGVHQAMQCLTRMREKMTRGNALRFDGKPAPPLAARILVGGKTQDFMGAMPGIFEEFLLATEKPDTEQSDTKQPDTEGNIPTYILGGFGGAAHVLAEALRSKDEQNGKLCHEHYRGKQSSLLAEKFKHNPAEQYKPYPEGPHLGNLYDQLNTRLKIARNNKLEILKNGLTVADNEELMTTTDSRVILTLLSKGLLKALGS
jgi:hypothetical protein